MTPAAKASKLKKTTEELCVLELQVKFNSAKVVYEDDIKIPKKRVFPPQVFSTPNTGQNGESGPVTILVFL